MNTAERLEIVRKAVGGRRVNDYGVDSYGGMDPLMWVARSKGMPGCQGGTSGVGEYAGRALELTNNDIYWIRQTIYLMMREGVTVPLNHYNVENVAAEGFSVNHWELSRAIADEVCATYLLSERVCQYHRLQGVNPYGGIAW